MRVTGGQLRGRVLESLSGIEIRPTPSKVRQAVFNILGNDISGFHVIDVFAGTGIMGIEALSRGADWVLFFDNAARSVNVIQKNLESCALAKRGFIVKGDINGCLPHHEKLDKGAIDLAFIDPPYGRELISAALDAIIRMGLMSARGIIVTESRKDDLLPFNTGDFILNKTRVYGETKIGIYERLS